VIPRSILPTVELEERIVHAISTLRAYTFIIKRGNIDIYDIYRLVHLVIKV